MSTDAPIPEPTDVGPAAGGDVPATSDDRTHAVALLNAAYAEGHLTADERDRRVVAVQSAATFDDLVPLTRDLMDIRAAGLATVAPVIDRTGAVDDTDSIVNIFSATNRTGRWRVRRRTSMLVCFGHVALDTTQAVFDAPEVEVSVALMFGGLDLIIPPGCEVHDSVGAIFGAVDRSKLAPPVPGMPVVNIRGFMMFGGVNVRHPKAYAKAHRYP